MADNNLFAQNGAVTPTLEPFQTELSTLAATLAIPIKVAPPPAGLAPEIKLVYSSAAAQSVVSEDYRGYQKAQASEVGFGWMIGSGGYIDTADNTHFAYLTLNGVTRTLVRTSEGGAEFRAQEEDFTKVRFYSGRTEGGVSYRYFKVWDKAGTEYRFGHEELMPYDQPPQYRATGSRHDAWWGWEDQYGWQCFPYPKRYYLDRVSDVHGNVMAISYQADQWGSPDGNHFEAAVYPIRIDYTTNKYVGSRTAQRRVEFEYADRYIGGVSDLEWARDENFLHYWETRRLTQIEVSVEEYNSGTGQWDWKLERQYELAYHYVNGENYRGEYNRQQRFLLLDSVAEKDGNGNALPATSFSYAMKECWDAQNEQRCALPLLTNASNGHGASVTWAYTSHPRTTGLGNARRIQYWAVQTRTIVEGTSGASHTTTYTPANPADPGVALAAWTSKLDAAVDNGYGTIDYWNPSFRGFTCVKVTEPTGHIHEHRFYRGLRDNDSAVVRRSDGGDLPDCEELKGKPYEVRWFENESGYTGNTPLGKEWYGYSSDGGYSYVSGSATDRRDRKIYKVFLQSQESFLGTSRSRRTFAHDTLYGNQTDVYEFADGAGRWTRHTHRWFCPRDVYAEPANQEPAATYITAKVAREEVYRNSDAPPDGDILEGATLNVYDTNFTWNQPPVSRGLRSLTRRQVAANQYVDTFHEHDVYGHLTATKRYGIYGSDAAWANGLPDNDERVATIGYDPQYLFATSETNPLSQTTQRLYYTSGGKFGLLSRLTDPNGVATDLDYDSFGRPTFVQGPPIGAYRKELQIEYLLADPGAGRTTTRVWRKSRVDSGGTPVWFNEYRFYDSAGRLVQEYSDADGGHLVANRYYDGRGLLGAQSVPHLVAGLSGAFAGADWTANSQPKTVFAYDGLRRPRITTLPDNQTTEQRYEGFDQLAVDQNHHVKRTKRDGLGRVVEVVEYSGTDGSLVEYASTQYGYDSADRLKRVVDALGNQTEVWYDLLGRKAVLADPDMGRWRYEYHPSGTPKTQTDANGQTIYFSYDALDRLVRKWYPFCWTEEVTLASKPTVYDLMELRAAVDTNRQAAGLGAMAWTDAEVVAGTGVTVQAAHFASLKSALEGLWTAAGMGAIPEFTAGPIVASGRKIMASDLTDLRGWLGQYEGSGYGQTKRARAYYEYDAFDGTSQFGKGRRTAMWDGCGRQAWQWDQSGRLTREERWLDGFSYVTQWDYDALDRVRTLTLPDNETLTYQYGANTLLSQIDSSLGLRLVSGVVYNDLGLPAHYVLSSQPTVANVDHTYYGLGYPGSPYGALRSIQQGTDLVNRTMLYDPVGNITQIVDGVNGNETITYQYDHLDRLLAASVPAGESYQYNQIGNITIKGELSYTYDLKYKHAVASFDGIEYSYDNNGCMTTRCDQTIRYDPESRPVRVSVGSTICRFAYDGDGVRRKRLDSNGTIHYLGAYERNLGNGLDTTAVVTKYYHALGRLVAFRKAGVLYWVGTDNLGSTIGVADASFNAVDQLRYRPFGEGRDPANNLNTDHRYTSQIACPYINLYRMGARSYDPVLGRFISPDTIVPDTKDPQALNRYSYCYNNPLKYTDPTGHAPGDDDPQWQAEFEQVHGRPPDEQDWQDRLFSLTHPGSGADGSWTEQDWQAYTKVQDILGGDLLNQIGSKGPSGADLYTVFGSAVEGILGRRDAGFEPGPDGTVIATSYLLPPGAAGFTLGNLIILRPDYSKDRALLMHEYVHVLQYRAAGISYGPDYVTRNGFYNPNGPLEGPAYAVESVYRDNPWLPGVWDFPQAGGHFYWRSP